MTNLQRRLPAPAPVPVSTFHATPEERLVAAARANSCVRWLKAQGFEVLYVQKGLLAPRVIIRECCLCEKLEGAARFYDRSMDGEQRYKSVMRFGCEVRWDDMGNFAREELKQRRAYQSTSVLRRLAAALSCAIGGAP